MWYWWVLCIVAVVVLFCIVAFLKRKSNVSEIKIENIVGEKCVVLETVDNYAGSGQVRVKRTEWAARSVDDEDIFDVGTVLRVFAVEGVKLICNKE